MKLKVKLPSQNAIVPTRETKDSPELDLFAIPPAPIQSVRTGVSVCVPEGMYASVMGRDKLLEKNYWLYCKSFHFT